MKKVIVLTTGGTIAMKLDEKTDGLVPAVSGDDLIKAVPALKDVCKVEVHEFSNVPSGYITPKMMFDLAHICDDFCADPEVAGVVITHGTDTMEETCYMLSLTAKTNKPIVTTGAMRGASDTGPDGPANILAAVRTAACPDAVGRGAMLVMNDEIHSAERVAKGHTTSCSTFISPGWGPIGHVYFDKVVFGFRPDKIEKIYPQHIVDDVALVKVCTGMDDYILRCLADKPVDGIVVEAYGCGNVQPAVKNGIEYARSKGIPVILTSRVFAGRVAEVYSYLGSAKSMADSNIIMSGELSGQKARIKLICALGITKDVNKLQKYFDL